MGSSKAVLDEFGFSSREQTASTVIAFFGSTGVPKVESCALA
jgi:hypothetical protein